MKISTKIFFFVLISKNFPLTKHVMIVIPSTVRSHVSLLATCLLSSKDYFVSSPNETIDYFNNLCSNDRSNPLLITFVLQTRSSNTLYALLNILCTNETDNERSAEQQYSPLLMSLSLSFSSNRQKQK